MGMVSNYIKLLRAFLDGGRHVLISYTNGDCDLFLVEEGHELEELTTFIYENDWKALAILLGIDGKKLINFSEVRYIEILEGN
jgi:hypothetical protein